jgi:GR25 family glycosyltransferase involved in LPS biosynthesis
MNRFNKFWDAAYVINLDRRPDRWEQLKTDAEAIGLEVTRWSAVDGKTDIDLEKHRIGTRTSKTSGIACFFSHIGVYRDALAKGYEKVLIIEDDAKLPLDFYEQLEKLFEFNFENFDTIYLGGIDKYPSKSLTENVNLCQFTLTLQANIFSRQCMEKILDIVDKEDEGKCRMSIDVLICERIQPQNKTYRSEPAIVTFYDGYSDIAGYKRSWTEATTSIKRQGTRNPKKWDSFIERGKNKLF